MRGYFRERAVQEREGQFERKRKKEKQTQEGRRWHQKRHSTPNTTSIRCHYERGKKKKKEKRVNLEKELNRVRRKEKGGESLKEGIKQKKKTNSADPIK